MNSAVQLRRAQLRAARSPAGNVRALFAGNARALLGVALALAVAACGDSASRSVPDEGLDASALDGGIVYLDAALDLSAPTDAGVPGTDAGALACVTSLCDPRLARPCGVELTNGCRLGADGPVCEGVLGTALAGGDCATPDDCAAGLDCFAALGGAGTCGLPCCPGDDASCGLGGRCASRPVLVGGAVTSWGRCVTTRACEVLRQDLVCDPGEGCYIVSSRGDTDCRAAGTLDVGASCDGEGACLPGLFCAGLMARTCVRICALGDGGAGVCPAGEGSCRAYPYSPAGTGICSTP